jgi:type II secretory pathway component GspD/PulD (secretin)
MKLQRLALPALLALTILPTALAQSAATKSSDCSTLPSGKERFDCSTTHAQIKTIYLANITTQSEANEILVAIRNVTDPDLKIFLSPSQNALIVSTYPEEMARIETVIHSLDRPHKSFRLTYTITEVDAGKAIGTEHISMVVVDGQRTVVKQGDKVPVATGTYSNGSAQSDSALGVQTQFTYLDVGMNIDATLTAIETGAALKTKVEQSSIGPTNTIAGVAEPVVRQSVLEGNTFLTLGKPVLIGSIDVPNSTRRLDIAVVMDPIK